MLNNLITAQMHYWDGDTAWWMWIIGPLMMLAVVGVIAWAIIVASRARPPQPPADDPTIRARAVLAERYARGEIETDEYRERLRQLT